MKLTKVGLVIIFFLALTFVAYAQGEEGLLLDDFEGAISGGPEGTVDFGAGGGSEIDVKASKEIKQRGAQALQLKFNAVAGGYMWAGRGYGLDIKGAGAWSVNPGDIDFNKFNAIALYVYGANTKIKIAIDLIDNGYEYWRYLIDDDFTGWKEIVIPFSEFFARGDWQPDKADKNGEFNLPFRAFQFEPRPVGEGTIYFDYVRIVNIKK